MQVFHKVFEGLLFKGPRKSWVDLIVSFEQTTKILKIMSEINISLFASISSDSDSSQQFSTYGPRGQHHSQETPGREEIGGRQTDGHGGAQYRRSGGRADLGVGAGWTSLVRGGATRADHSVDAAETTGKVHLRNFS